MMESYLTAPVKETTFLDSQPFYRTKTLLKAANETSGAKTVTFDATQRSHAGLPWRTNTYYGASTNNPSVPNAHSMPTPTHEQHVLKNTDTYKTPPIFSAARTNLYTRYNPENWQTANDLNWISGDRVRAASEAVRREAVNVCKELDERTKLNQQISGKKLGDRIGEIEQWRVELGSEIDETTNELRALEKDRIEMEKILLGLKEPLRIAQECLYAREKRRGIDLVHDNVEKQLVKEIDVLKHFQNHINDFLGDVNSQISLSRAALHELQKDLGDKEVALGLENSCHQMNDNSRHVNYYDSVHRIDNSTSVPITWMEHSSNNVKRARAERGASLFLRKKAFELAKDCAQSVNEQWNAVNSALNDRLKEYQEAKNRLQLNLLQTLQEIQEQEKVIEGIKHSIEVKGPPLKVAQTRLATRTKRPNVEACRDLAHHRLVGEVQQLGDSVEKLRIQLLHAENSLQNLLRVKLSLEHDLSNKNNSILIDRQKCLDLRFNPLPHKAI